MNYIGQAIGIVAIIISVLIYYQHSRAKMVFFKLITDVLWVLHHLLIFSYTAAATTGIAIIREIVFLRGKKSRLGHVLNIVIFSIMFVTVSLFTWKDVFSFFPALASVLATVAFGSDREKLIRVFAFISSVSMLFYGIHYCSIPTIINEVLVESSIAVILYKEHKTKGL